MDAYEARSELRRMPQGILFNLAANQRISKCLIGGAACPFYFCYKGFHFCISELLGQGCQIERANGIRACHGDIEAISSASLFVECPGEPRQTDQRERNPEFRVYCRDEATRSIVFVGTVIERRTRERGNNLRDLLIKAVNEYSDRVSDPSTIFLLGP
jgi:hypothetical protein